MGQYFTYGLKTGEDGIKPNGLTMTEHSYIYNASVAMLYYLLCDETYREFIDFARGELLGHWRNKPVVHCGDYSDISFGDTKLYQALTESSVDFMERLQVDIFGRLVSTSKTSLSIPDLRLEETLDRLFDGKPLYVLNHSKKQILDVRAHIFMHRVLESEKDGEVFGMLDPLSLLLVETDGEGGGDYRGEYSEMVGSWSQDAIEIVQTKPLAAAKYADVTMSFYFSEASDLFDNGRLSLQSRTLVYATYNENFGRKHVKKGGVIRTWLAPKESESLCDMIELSKWAVKQAKQQIKDECARNITEAEVINISNQLITLATVDDHFNYSRLGEVKLTGQNIRIGDVVKVGLNPLRLVG